MPVGTNQIPPRRFADLVVRVQDDETLVLDTRTDTAHCLPAEVARIWDACSAGRTLADIAAAAGVDEDRASAAVDQLLELNLLDVPSGLDRRKFLRRTVLVGGSAAAIPLIQSVVGPLASAAASPPPPTCHAVIHQTGCASSNRAVYELTVSGLAPGSYNVTVTYKNNVVQDNFAITVGASGTTTTTQTTGAGVPQGSAGDVTVQVFSLAGALICQDNGLSFTKC